MGNIRATIQGEKNGESEINLLSMQDYYPFGSPMPGRSIANTAAYKQGYQRQQVDGETSFNAFELRLYDSRLGSWLTPDPYRQQLITYMAMSNNPFSFIDPDGGYSYWNVENRENGGTGGFSNEETGYGQQDPNSASYNYKSSNGGLSAAFDNYSSFNWEHIAFEYATISNYEVRNNMELKYRSKTGQYGYWEDGYSIDGEFHFKRLDSRDMKVIGSGDAAEIFSKFSAVNLFGSGQTNASGSFGGDDAMIGVNAFLVGNGAKKELLNYAVRSGTSHTGTRAQLQVLGKTGVKYLGAVKGLSIVGSVITSTYSAYNAGSYYANGGTGWQVGTKATMDIIMTGVGFIGPIGFGVSATYFIIDTAGGFGDFGDIKP